MALHESAALAEPEIDAEHRRHPLLRRAFPEAIAHLLLAAERLSADDASQLEKQDRSITLTDTVDALKHAVAWIHSSTQRATNVTVSLEALEEGYDFLKKATAYSAVFVAFSNARRNLVDLASHGTQLNATLPSNKDARYDAYDILVPPSIRRAPDHEPPSLIDLKREIDHGLDRHCVVNTLAIARNVLEAAYRVSGEMYDAEYLFPPEWTFATFTANDFRRVSNAVRAVAGASQAVNMLAARRDEKRHPQQLCVISERDLIAASKDLTGLPKGTVSRVLDILKYGTGDVSKPDPVLQPLIEVLPRQFILSSPLVLGGSPERNLTALLNALPTERARYDVLKNEKEALMRARMDSRRPPYLRPWHGRITGRRDLPDVDYALIDDRTRSILLIELKWFIAPAEVREVAERNEDLKKGVKQVKQLLAAVAENPATVPDLGWAPAIVAGVVVSANSIGTVEAQDSDVAIINEEHFLRKLERAADLAEVVEWLRRRDYLPIPGVHFRYHRLPVEYFEWRLCWYGYEALEKGDFLPL